MQSVGAIELDAPEIAAASDREVTRLRLTILRLSRGIRRNASLRLSPPQQSLLAILDSYGPLTPGRLAEIESVQPPSVTRVLGQLEDAGYVTRAPVKDNLRQVQVRLTPAGKKAAAEVHSARDEWLASAVEALPQGHKIRLHDIVETLELLLGDTSSDMAQT
ncbi:MAG: MarR family transcriptional regulator [Sphingomonadales bacterium]